MNCQITPHPYSIHELYQSQTFIYIICMELASKRLDFGLELIYRVRYICKRTELIQIFMSTNRLNIISCLLELLAATKQLYEWFSPSVRLSVCTSVRLCVRHTFLTMFPSSYHPEIFRSYYQWQKWCPCKRSRSKVKVTEVKTQLSRFRTVTPVWIDIWWWNDA